MQTRSHSCARLVLEHELSLNVVLSSALRRGQCDTTEHGSLQIARFLRDLLSADFLSTAGKIRFIHYVTTGRHYNMKTSSNNNTSRCFSNNRFINKASIVIKHEQYEHTYHSLWLMWESSFSNPCGIKQLLCTYWYLPRSRGSLAVLCALLGILLLVQSSTDWVQTYCVSLSLGAWYQ